MMNVTIDVNGAVVGRLSIRRIEDFVNRSHAHEYVVTHPVTDPPVFVKHVYKDGWGVLVEKALTALREQHKWPKFGGAKARELEVGL